MSDKLTTVKDLISQLREAEWRAGLNRGSANKDMAAAQASQALINFLTPLLSEPFSGQAASAAGRHPLEAYAESYEQMGRDGDGRVHCSSVAVDIRQNMIPATASPTQPASAPAREGDCACGITKESCRVTRCCDATPAAPAQPREAQVQTDDELQAFVRDILAGNIDPGEVTKDGLRMLAEALTTPPAPRHTFWGAGEPDCPPELLAPNGELHTLRCKVCGDGWRQNRDVCSGIPAPQSIAPKLPAEPTDEDLEKVVLKALQGSTSPRSWDALTYDIGPYDITKARPIAIKIAREAVNFVLRPPC